MAASTNAKILVQLLPSPANTRYPLYSWVGWSNVSEISCSRKQQQTELSGDQTDLQDHTG